MLRARWGADTMAAAVAAFNVQLWGARAGQFMLSPCLATNAMQAGLEAMTELLQKNITAGEEFANKQ